MDHFWQIGGPGSELEPMLEGVDRSRVHGGHNPTCPVGLMVGGVHYRNPGLLGQGGDHARRSLRGTGLARTGRRVAPGGVRGTRVPLPRHQHRFEMLEDTLLIARGMWQGERGSEESFAGRQFTATRLLNVPQSISRPGVPIMIGGGGEKRTPTGGQICRRFEHVRPGPISSGTSTRSWPSTAPPRDGPSRRSSEARSSRSVSSSRTRSSPPRRPPTR